MTTVRKIIRDYLPPSVTMRLADKITTRLREHLAEEAQLKKGTIAMMRLMEPDRDADQYYEALGQKERDRAHSLVKAVVDSLV